MKTYFTSDTHFGHSNIIKYCNRPFSSTDEMDEALIENINSVVQPWDRLIHGGDFCFKSATRLREYRERINCKNIVLIMGNHDPHKKNGEPQDVVHELFQGVHNLLKIKVPYKERKQSIIVCHYAMRVWNNSHHSSFHCYGHSHGSLWDDPCSLSLDVGVDAEAKRLAKGGLLDPRHYKPMSVERIFELMSKKTFTPVDHHNKDTN